MMNNYGDRQERAETLVRLLRNQEPKKVAYKDWKGVEYTFERLAEHIEDGSALGANIVAIGGLVIAALQSEHPVGASLHKPCTGCGKVVLGPHACPGPIRNPHRR